MSGRNKAPKVPPPHYDVGDRVLCFHGPLLYEAKVLVVKPGQAGETPKSPEYKVHYKGWKSSWDEWVPQDRALKWSDENLTLQDSLRNEHKPRGKKDKEKKKESKSGTDEPSGPTPLSKKRHREMDMDKEEDFNRRHEIRLEVPDNLKSLLVDDWEYITKLGQHVPLPREVSVADVLEDYSKYAKGPGNSSIDALQLDELTAGLKLYFNKALGTRLLYRHEREQYSNIRHKFPEKDMHEVYGAEHLARMFVIMPELVAHTNLDIQSTNVLKQYLEEMLAWLESTSNKYFLPGYEGGTPSSNNKAAAAAAAKKA